LQTGMRESGQSWKELLVDLKARGLSIAPNIAVGDGALGFWRALEEAFPSTRHQRCWQHKTLNVLDKLPKSVQPNAHRDLREIWLSENRATAEAAITIFAEKYAPKYDKAVDCLLKDRDALLTFFDFPAEHWTHLRTSDEIDKQFLRQRAIYGERERPRGEARRVGCKRRQASYSFLAGLRRSRAWPFGGRGRQASTKCW
jgi:putative transposase